MNPPAPPTHPHGHCCTTCEIFWRDESPRPSPCPNCGQLTPLGTIADLLALAGRNKTPTWGPFALGRLM